MAEHSLGHEAASVRNLQQAIQIGAKAAAYQIAEAYAWRGQSDEAFEWLDRAYTQRDGGLTVILVDPLLASLRVDQRYGAMLKKLGLVH